MTHVRVAHLHDHYRRDHLLALIGRLLTAIEQHAEAVGMFAILCAFWGLVLYAAAVGLP